MTWIYRKWTGELQQSLQLQQSIIVLHPWVHSEPWPVWSQETQRCVCVCVCACVCQSDIKTRFFTLCNFVLLVMHMKGIICHLFVFCMCFYIITTTMQPQESAFLRYFWDFVPLTIGHMKTRTGNGRDREGTTCNKEPQGGIEPVALQTTFSKKSI